MKCPFPHVPDTSQMFVGNSRIFTKSSLLLISLTLGTLGIALDNASGRGFDEEALRAYKEQAAFQYTANAQEGSTWLARAFYWVTQRFFELLSTPGGTELGKGLLYFLLGAAVVGGVWLIISMRYGRVFISDKDRRSIILHSLDKEESANYEQYFEDARGVGDHQLAARYLFLWTLQRMSQRGLIQWKGWKTSQDYLREISEDKQGDYLSLARFFEASWFGKNDPSPDEVHHFQELAKQLVHD